MYDVVRDLSEEDKENLKIEMGQRVSKKDGLSSSGPSLSISIKDSGPKCSAHFMLSNESVEQINYEQSLGELEILPGNSALN
jgi:hypothetical protein